MKESVVTGELTCPYLSVRLSADTFTEERQGRAVYPQPNTDLAYMSRMCENDSRHFPLASTRAGAVEAPRLSGFQFIRQDAHVRSMTVMDKAFGKMTAKTRRIPATRGGNPATAGTGHNPETI
jgi:hypothetical protein